MLAAARLGARRCGGSAARRSAHAATPGLTPDQSFDAALLTTELTDAPAPKPPLDASLQFGRVFTDHMLQVDWTRSCGWGAPRITPLRPFSLHPASQTLQYGAHCFEGMKAYAGPDCAPRLFRPELNMARLLSSATRLALPPFCPEQALRCVAALVRADVAWLPPPAAAGFALYIRPALAATTPFLGVGPPLDATFFAVLSPCGPYLSPGKAGGSGDGGVALFLDETLVRAAPGGVGAFKVGGNYAPTIAPAVAAAARHGAAQVLFTAPGVTAGGEDRTVAEAGAMNVFFVLRSGSNHAIELVTPPLDGTILPGVTRRSVLELARGGGVGYAGQPLTVSERPLRVAELADAAREGRLLEAFATGTAAVIMPVRELIREAAEPLRTAGPPAGQPPLSAVLAARLADIQYGRTPHPWSVPL